MSVHHCGGQHHFIAKCQFHLATRVGDYVVSTVGEYHPPGADPHDEWMPLSIGPEIYETMVFKAQTLHHPSKEQMCPCIPDVSEHIATARYMTYTEANAGHATWVENMAAL